jgi:uncharacterized protein
MNPVVHFEMPAGDRQRMVDFYTTVFGWQSKKFGPEMGNYVTVATTKADLKTGHSLTPGVINGGFYMKDPKKKEQYPTIVIAVDDIKVHIGKIKATGGEILNGPDDIPGVGIYAAFRDTEGNRVAMLQPLPLM